MITVGVRELKQNTSELIRKVRMEGSEIQVTYRGKVVALLIPAVRSEKSGDKMNAWAELDRLATEIGLQWPAGVSAVQAVEESRR